MLFREEDEDGQARADEEDEYEAERLRDQNRSGGRRGLQKYADDEDEDDEELRAEEADQVFIDDFSNNKVGASNVLGAVDEEDADQSGDN